MRVGDSVIPLTVGDSVPTSTSEPLIIGSIALGGGTPYFVQKGWECPKCGAILSPTSVFCPFCASIKKANTIDNTGLPRTQYKSGSEILCEAKKQ